MVDSYYGSDLVADLLNHYDLPFVSLNPGSSFRGLHDSIVNHSGNHPEMIECTHEEVAVAIAHGYAKATGRPMAAILHNVVGLLHGAMAVYYAYIDRTPVLVLGGGGPMEIGKRRPRVDWDHTAVMQGNAVRDFVKWDDQPFDLDGIIEGFARGYRLAVTEPQGPVYLCYDVPLQEDEVPADVRGRLVLPSTDKPLAPTRFAADPDALEQAAQWLTRAQSPVITADFLGRNQDMVPVLVELAELLAAPVVDLNARMNFPNTHPLFSLRRDVVRDADGVLALDVRDLYGAMVGGAGAEARGRPSLRPGCRVIDIGLADLTVSSWSQHFQRYFQADLSILADTKLALPQLLAACRRHAPSAPPSSSVARSEQRLAERARFCRAEREKWIADAQADENWGGKPMSPARLCYETFQAIRDKDWVLTANTVEDWARKLWDFDKPYRHVGKALGTATQIGISLGVALAYRGTGKLVVDMQPDGDLLFDAGALWIAAYHKIPMLCVMYNNRSYYNDWDHQINVARHRGRDESMAYLGMEIANPAPDFAAMARSMGWYAEGPIESGDDVEPAVRRAIQVIEDEGRPALVDTVTTQEA
jgi:acetolactate synthase I/II/III large subunit